MLLANIGPLTRLRSPRRRQTGGAFRLVPAPGSWYRNSPTAEGPSRMTADSHFRPSRRPVLQAGAAAALGLFWNGWLRAEAVRPAAGKAKSVILIFNSGAPSHIDLWDPKPAAPETVRGPFQPIATTVPGIRVTRLLPNLAKQAHRYAVVRTVHHSHTQHNSGMHWSIVGRPYRIDNTLINPSRADLPGFGTLVGWLARRDGSSSALPPYVITPAPHCDSP